MVGVLCLVVLDVLGVIADGTETSQDAGLVACLLGWVHRLLGDCGCFMAVHLSLVQMCSAAWSVLEACCDVLRVQAKRAPIQAYTNTWESESYGPSDPLH